MKENNHGKWQMGLSDKGLFKITNNDYDYYKEFNFYETTTKKTEPTIWELIDMIEKIIEKHPRNIKKILDNLPEEEIQKYLRAKKMAKIKRNAK